MSIANIRQNKVKKTDIFMALKIVFFVYITVSMLFTALNIYHIYQIKSAILQHTNNINLINELKNDVYLSMAGFVVEVIVLWLVFVFIWFNILFKSLKTKYGSDVVVHEGKHLAPLFEEVMYFFSSIFCRQKKSLNVNSHYFNCELSEQYLINVSNLIPSAIIGLDRQGLIQHLNSAAEKLIECGASVVLGKPIQSIIIELDPYMDLIRFALKTKQFKTFNKIKISINGVEHILKIVAYPFKKTWVTLYIDDITEKVITESLLIQAEKMTALGTLAAGMAHEINNPLGGILQSVQNITRRLDPNNQKNIDIATEHGISLLQVQKYLEEREISQFLEGIRVLSERATSIVKNILHFSRRSDNQKVAVDINSIIQDTIAIISIDYDIKKQLQRGELVIQAEVINNTPKIYCIPIEIEQVLLNLIKNAVQALAEKQFIKVKPTVTVRVKSIDKNIRVEVADNGPGIPVQLKQHLFKPFFTTKPIGVGTGLGLSISRYIVVDKHQGKLKLESTVGEGTVFIIELPVDTSKL